MLKRTLSVVLLLAALAGFSQGTPADAIRKVMADQAEAWNRGSIDDFMKGYWNNDSLAFVGTNGITYGYKQTLAHYKKTYNSPEKMGKLFFTLLRVDRLSPGYYHVVGKWLLKRSAGDIGGIYTLLFRKVRDRWVIVMDHTS